MILQLLFQVLMLLLSRPAISMAKPPSSPSFTKPNCPSSCGNNVEIPFPFGIGADCYFDESYAVDCESNKPILRSIGLELLNISLERSTMKVNQPVINSCQDKPGEVSFVNLESLPFFFSYHYNYFFGVGCNNLVLMYSADRVNKAVLGGCFSICNSKSKPVNDDKFCIDGIECCQSGYSFGLQSFKISVRTINVNETRSSSQKMDCKYAFLIDTDSFKHELNSTKEVLNWKQVPVSLNWRLSNSSYDKLEMNTPTKIESTFYCETDQEDGLQICHCRDGYQGNPYLFQGCQDVDECKSRRPDICETNMVCQNSIGGYHCVPHEKSKVSVIILGIGTGLGGLFLLAGAWWAGMLIRKRMKQKEENFKRNGGLLLQQQLNSIDSSVDRCKIFNSNELDKATDHFNDTRVLGQGGQGTVYKGMLQDGRIVAVKKSNVVNEGKLEEFVNEVIILSQVNHRNVVKLLGCCLETDVPLLVYEFISNGTLFQYLHHQNEEFPFTWDIRLRIATEVSEALSYLHSATYSPIFHRDIKSTNILLDKKYRAKIADFGTSRSIAIDQTHVSTKVQGTFGYLDPEYFHSSQFTDKSDVYSFGVVLVELLTGLKPISSTWAEEGKNLATFFVILLEEDRLFDVLDIQVKQTGKEEDITIVADIAKRCLNPIGKKRPKMKEVAMELERIRASQNGNNAPQISKDDECSRTEITELWDMVSTSTTTFESITHTLKVEHL